MAGWCSRWKAEVWAYCLMLNHVHLIAVPPSKETLTGAIAKAHRSFTCRVNLREGWTGHLWQGRFSSFPLEETLGRTLRPRKGGPKDSGGKS